MTVEVNESAFVVPTMQSIALSQMFTITASADDPAYLVLTGLDRDEYTADATDSTGSLTGAGITATFAGIGGDARGVGVVFAYQAPTGRYYNGAYGYLDQLTYDASASPGDVTNISLFGTNRLRQATTYGANPDAMMQLDPSGYLGSVTVATEPGFSGPVPSQATPASIAAVADSLVGQAWNMSGCWVLASTVAAEAGASLPVQSTALRLPGQANDEWIVAYNGPASQAGDWQAMVSAGDVVAFETSNGGGHITTCVSGSGATAMLVDNITYEDASGQVLNAANDGSASDVTIAAPHAASQEWSGVQADSVVIYELDTPVVDAQVAGVTMASGGSQNLGSLFSVKDPAGKTVTAYQVYDTDGSGVISVNGTTEAAHSAASAVTASSLSQVSLETGAAAGSDMLHVRAFNGAYWGDWTSLGINSIGQSTVSIATAPSTSVVAVPTPTSVSITSAPIASSSPALVDVGNFSWMDTTTSTPGSGPGEVYTGPVNYLQWQYLWAGQDSIDVSANVPNVFVRGGTGDDALAVSAGSNVLDGDTGSNFLVGAPGADGGADTFFLNGGSAVPTWDTLVNFHSGDALTLWGFVPGQSTMTWADNEGAVGYKGATLQASFAGGLVDGSVTFAGVSLVDAQSEFATSSGMAGNIPYLYVRYNM